MAHLALWLERRNAGSAMWGRESIVVFWGFFARVGIKSSRDGVFCLDLDVY